VESYRELVDALTVPVFEVRGNFKNMAATEVDFLHACVGLSTEAGELLDVAKKILFYGQSMDEHRENIREELGDLIFYLELACAAMSTDSDSMKAKNKVKLLTRYSSGRFSKEEAKCRLDKSLDTPDPAMVQNKDGSFEI
jgi:NTP pyrophosphatase (non-canonical NTP hydrolase)